MATTALPTVLVTTTIAAEHGVARVRTNVAYVRALESAGCVPLLLPPLAGAEQIRAALAGVQGVLLTGGEDVDPACYGAEPHPATQPPNRERDAAELLVVAEARRRRLPLLAICRGVQLLAVASGGTLVQDLPSERPGPVSHDEGPRHARVHAVAIHEGTRLAAALGATRLRVNSRHHQAVSDPGPALRAVAHAPDGVIEGAEALAPDWWAVGVQWHPEDLVGDAEPWDRRLFEAFATVARGA